MIDKIHETELSDRWIILRELAEATRIYLDGWFPCLSQRSMRRIDAAFADSSEINAIVVDSLASVVFFSW